MPKPKQFFNLSFISCKIYQYQAWSNWLSNITLVQALSTSNMQYNFFKNIFLVIVKTKNFFLRYHHSYSLRFKNVLTFNQKFSKINKKQRWQKQVCKILTYQSFANSHLRLKILFKLLISIIMNKHIFQANILNSTMFKIEKCGLSLIQTMNIMHKAFVKTIVPKKVV